MEKGELGSGGKRVVSGVMLWSARLPELTSYPLDAVFDLIDAHKRPKLVLHDLPLRITPWGSRLRLLGWLWASSRRACAITR